MIRLPPSSTLTDTLFPYTTLFRSFFFADGAMREDSIADKQGQAAVDLNGNDVARLKLHKLRQRQAGPGQYAARRKPHMVHLPAKPLAPGRLADLQLIMHARAHQWLYPAQCRSEAHTSELQSPLR